MSKANKFRKWKFVRYIKFIISSYSRSKLGNPYVPVQLNPTRTHKSFNKYLRSSEREVQSFQCYKEPTTSNFASNKLFIYLLKSLIKRLRAGVDIIYLRNSFRSVCLAMCPSPGTRSICRFICSSLTQLSQQSIYIPLYLLAVRFCIESITFEWTKGKEKKWFSYSIDLESTESNKRRRKKIYTTHTQKLKVEYF